MYIGDAYPNFIFGMFTNIYVIICTLHINLQDYKTPWKKKTCKAIKP
jgi:hypothetical protein